MRTNRRFLPFGVALAVAAGAVVTWVAVTTAPAQAATNDFRGVNWADQRDNFVNDTLVLGGLATSDSYATTQAKADRILSGFQANLGANTVRLPVNYPTVSGSYWNSYVGAIDMATSKGMKVILSYWEADNSRDGLVDNTTQFWSMWQTIVNRYAGNGLVYFEPMNEPHGYSDADWKNVAAQWLSNYPSVPRGRIIVSGAGYNTRLITIGSDSRFNGTLISRHIYRFFNNNLTTEAQFRAELRTSVGSYASRVLITEWGSFMTDGRNYNQPSAGDAFVSFIRGVAAEARSLQLGTVYWPGVRIADPYRLQEVSGSGTNLTVSTTNASGRDQLRYSWGLNDNLPPTPPAPTYYRVVNRNSGRVMDVVGASTANNAEVKQYAWNGGGNQMWVFEDAGSGYVRLVNAGSGKCLDVAGAATADGANIIQYTCGSATNQQWQWRATGSYFQLVARHSGKCLDVVGAGTADGVDITQYTCGSGTNQQWSRIQS
ncbi:RICIN domain-containing protein [Phytohabitans rumicis]|uniref:RICIN domain-containing protein n=1 Tax=Phytohabitans rumicis TaxID=1076125 RepID=UPI001564EAE4|nr:RICIN domain-containing protein [Phytohabitans rumicis]